MSFFEQVSDWFQQLTLSGWMPVVLIVVLLLILGIVGALIYFLRRPARMAPKEAPPEAAPPPQPKPRKDPIAPDLAESFAQAMELLKANVSGPQPRYQVPWFLMLGQTGAGKTALLEHCGLNRPFALEETQKLNGCRWWFFDKGLVLDLTGEYILRRDEKTSDEKSWKSILRLLQKYRGERPLDGIILTIPSEDLLIPLKNKEERLPQLANKADLLYTKLREAQQQMEMQLPIYIVVTKCDQLAGFSSFCGEIPERLRNDLFGWSNPYTVDTAYNPQWAEEIFQSVQSNLNKTQMEVIADGIQVEDRDGFFLFPSEFNSLAEPLKVYLNHLFRPSAYHESFFLRGVYFAGDGAFESGPIPLTADEIEREPGSEEHDSFSIRLQASNTEASESSTLAPPFQEKKPIFFRHLLERKIFPEFGLARPTARPLLSRHRAIMGMQIATVSLGIIWGIGLWMTQARLREQVATIKPFFNAVAADMEEIEQEKQQGNLLLLQSLRTQRQDIITERAKRLFEGLGNINAQSMRTLFIPSTWLSSIHGRITTTITKAYDEIVVRSLYAGLGRKASEILEGTGISATLDEDVTLPALHELPEFLALEAFVQQANELEKQAKVYNTLKDEDDLKLLAGLAKYTYGFEILPTFFENADYYDEALLEISYKPFETGLLKTKIVARFRILAKAFFTRIFQQNDLKVALEEASAAMQNLGQRTTTTQEDLAVFQTILLRLQRAELLLKHPQMAWIYNDSFDGGEAIEGLMEGLDSSELLGQELRNEFEQASQQRFYDFTKDLENLRSPLTGSLLQFVVPPSSKPNPLKLSKLIQQGKMAQQILKNPLKGGLKVAEQQAKIQDKNAAKAAKAGTSPATAPPEPILPIQLSPVLLTIKGALEDFFNQRFVILEPAHQLLNNTMPDTQLRWEVNLLNESVSLAEPYLKFLGTGIEQFPLPLQKHLKVVAVNKLKLNMLDMIAQAQSFEPVPQGSRLLMEAELGKGVQQFQKAAVPLDQILTVMQQLQMSDAYDEVMQVTLKQVSTLLQWLDQLLEQEQLYLVGDLDLMRWDGHTKLATLIYGVQNANELQAYLNAQRERMSRLANQYAKPLVSFLENRKLDPNSMDLGTLGKWQKILAEVLKRDNQTPNNSISVLENYITNELDQISADNCHEKLALQRNISVDFFIQRRNELQQALFKHCQAMLQSEVVQSYQRTSSGFGQNLGDLQINPRSLQALPLQQIPEYVELRQFLDELLRLERLGENIRILQNSAVMPYPSNYNPVTFRNNVLAQHYRLTQRLYQRLFQANPVLVAARNVGATLQTLDQKSRTNQADLNQFQELLQSLRQLESMVAHPENAWLFKDTLVWSDAMTQLFDLVNQSRFLGTDLRKAMETNAQNEFQAMRTAMRVQETQVTGSLLQQEKANEPMKLAPGTAALKTSLEDFLNQRFMLLGSERHLEITPKPGTRLVWDANGLQEAVTMATSYDRFINKEFKRFSVDIQRLLRQLALARLRVNLMDAAARAQQFEIVTETVDRLKMEDNIRLDTQSFQAAAPLLGQLLNALDQLGLQSEYKALFQASVSNAYDLLQGIDQMLENQKLYALQASDTNNWDGTTPIWMAFGIREPADLGPYLEKQRERLKQFAFQYAGTLVDFLTTRKDVQQIANPLLIVKWQGILGEFKNYENKQPGNAIAFLENFIAKDLEGTTVENCFQKLSAISTRPNDFFQSRYAALQSELSKRCQELVNVTVVARYSVLAQQFNQTLAGRFPFAAPNALDQEVTPKAMQNFFMVFDDYLAKAGPAMLQQAKGFGSSHEQAVQFIQQLQLARKLFGTYLESSDKEQLPALDFEVEFRVNEAKELGGNQIIEWRLIAGEISLSKADPLTPVRWTYGTPVRLVLRWAKDAPMVPVTDPADPQMRVQEGVVTYDYFNQWALLGLLTKHTATPKDFDRFNDPKPHTLKFEIATKPLEVTSGKKPAATVPVRVFVRLKFLGPDQKESLLAPTFPVRAPLLKSAEELSSLRP